MKPLPSDGTNSYAWDAENRLIKITYPGSGNYSSFVYDGLSRNATIVETTGGSVTSTKQFVWSQDKLCSFRPCEQRNAAGGITAQFFGGGELISSSSYFYAMDQLGSTREMTDNSGNIQAEYSLDPFGRVAKISESVASDFGFTGYYCHARSGLNQATYRSYSSSLARFISRDPIGETGGINLFAYVGNNPISKSDMKGLKCGAGFAGWGPYGPMFGNWGGQALYKWQLCA